MGTFALANGTCTWVKDEHDLEYHNNEWCLPEHDDQKLFEFLILEGMQAGLSWNLILRRLRMISGFCKSSAFFSSL